MSYVMSHHIIPSESVSLISKTYLFSGWSIKFRMTPTVWKVLREKNLVRVAGCLGLLLRFPEIGYISIHPSSKFRISLPFDNNFTICNHYTTNVIKFFVDFHFMHTYQSFAFFVGWPAACCIGWVFISCRKGSRQGDVMWAWAAAAALVGNA